MGEADAARMLVQAVDVEHYTPRMVEVAAQTALATADPAALCPLVAPARSLVGRSGLDLADGMCAALEGEAARASALIDQARNRAGTGIDLLLAEKVVGAGARDAPRGRHRVGRGRPDRRLALRPRQRDRRRDPGRG